MNLLKRFWWWLRNKHRIEVLEYKLSKYQVIHSKGIVLGVLAEDGSVGDLVRVNMDGEFVIYNEEVLE